MNALFADVLFYSTVLVYVVAAGLFGLHLSGSDRVPTAARLAPRVVLVGVLLRAAHIVVSSLVLKVCPVEGMHFAMSVVSMFAGVAYLALRARYRIDVVGAFVTPVALTFLIGSRWVAVNAGEPSARVRGAILPLHVTANLVGDALFMLACGAAIAYLVQEQPREEGPRRHLPAPPRRSTRSTRPSMLSLLGLLLTLGILTGTVWARKVKAGTRARDPRLRHVAPLRGRALSPRRGQLARAARGVWDHRGLRARIVVLAFAWRSAGGEA
ncbi:MAG: cytochrome c biogenesis protein CcsA [Polyangiaceae bacterium]